MRCLWEIIQLSVVWIMIEEFVFVVCLASGKSLAGLHQFVNTFNQAVGI